MKRRGRLPLTSGSRPRYGESVNQFLGWR
jgi:hypothetical protein